MAQWLKKGLHCGRKSQMPLITHAIDGKGDETGSCRISRRLAYLICTASLLGVYTDAVQRRLVARLFVYLCLRQLAASVPPVCALI